MRTYKETRRVIEWDSGEGEIVETMDGRYRMDSIVYEVTTFDNGETLETVSAKGRKVRKDGAYPERSVYTMPVWGDEVDAIVERYRVGRHVLFGQ